MANDYIKTLSVELKNDKAVDKIAKALANKTRRDILRLLASGPRTINNIAFELDTPISTTSEHISILLKSGIVSVINHSNERGLSKVISRQFEDINIKIIEPNHATNGSIYQKEIPIGSYFDFSVSEYCGILDENGYIGPRDSSISFYLPERNKASLIWFSEGYLEYALPIEKERVDEISSIEITVEICSEAPGYNENWKSDIFFEINKIPLGIYVSPGDFGAHHGALTPEWWLNGGTQYGLLKKIEIKNNGTFIDGNKISDVTTKDLKLEGQNIMFFKLGVHKDAKNKGGINIFGKTFGDYPQDIILTINYK